MKQKNKILAMKSLTNPRRNIIGQMPIRTHEYSVKQKLENILEALSREMLNTFLYIIAA